MHRILKAVPLVLLALPFSGCGSRDAVAGPNVAARYRFRVEIDGTAMAFRTVEGMKIEQEVIEYNPGQGGPIRKLPGKVKVLNFLLKRPYVGKPASEPMLDWMRATRAGQDVRKNVSVIILKSDGTETHRYDYVDCFLTAYSLTPLDADSDSECEETIEICVSHSSNFLM